MGFFNGFKGRRAYQMHVQGNQYIEKGDLEKAREKHETALKLYEEAYQAGGMEPSVMMAYAVLLMRFGQYEKARDLLLLCEKSKKLDAKSKKQLRQNYSVCQWRLGNLDKAIELMRESERNGKTSFIYTVLGYFLIEKAIQTGSFDEALAYNMEAYEYDEDDAGTLDNLGQLYYAMGDADKAYEYFARAYEAKKTQVPTLYFIAKINLERGNLEKARQFAQLCLAGNFSALCSVSREDAQKLSDEIDKAQG